MTAPLTPLDCDLRDFPRMMVDVPRLMGSEFNAIASRSPIAWMIGHKLWYRAWHQVPAASLPDDDEQLCHLAELGFDVKTWRKAKEIALRNWVRCDDGRLYHPAVAEAALEAWIEKLMQRLSSGAGNAKRYGHTFDPTPLNAAIEAAAGLLHDLNPRSRAADKLKRRQSRPAPDALPPGGEKAPTGRQPGVPPASLGTGTGTGTGKQERKEREGDSVVAFPAPEGGQAAPRTKGSRLKADWNPSADNLAYAVGEGFTEAAARRMAENFRDYWIANATPKAVKLDWTAAWRTWVRNERDRRAPTTAPKRQGFV